MATQRQPYTALYLAAGLSSRFGGRIKCLQAVGRSGETLLELSVRQLITFGVSDLVIIVSAETLAPIREVVGDSFLGLSVRYCIQEKPTWRKKPLGTVHALLSAKALIRSNNFIVLNGDTLYGKAALAAVTNHISAPENNNSNCMPGYALKDVLPLKGKVNRAIISVDHQGTRLEQIVEQYNIEMHDIESGKYTGNELTSMNIFGFTPKMFEYAQSKFDSWLDSIPKDPSSTDEYILSTMLNDLYKDLQIPTQVYPLNASVPLELTNPEDFAFVRNNLSLVGL